MGLPSIFQGENAFMYNTYWQVFPPRSVGGLYAFLFSRKSQILLLLSYLFGPRCFAAAAGERTTTMTMCTACTACKACSCYLSYIHTFGVSPLVTFLITLSPFLALSRYLLISLLPFCGCHFRHHRCAIGPCSCLLLVCLFVFLVVPSNK